MRRPKLDLNLRPLPAFFNDMNPQLDAHNDMLGKEPRKTVTPPPERLGVRLICKDCHINPPNLVERDEAGVRTSTMLANGIPKLEN